MIGYWQQPVVRPSVRLSVWWERQRRNGMVETSNVILKALTEFLRNLCNGNGKTATERWKPGIRPFPTQYTMLSSNGRNVLEVTHEEKDLGITVTSDLMSRYYWTVDNANLLRFTRRSYHLD